jgi:ABC-type transporter lipoprotein component MlaA
VEGKTDLITLSRFFVNSTVGIAGLWDLADTWGSNARVLILVRPSVIMV